MIHRGSFLLSKQQYVCVCCLCSPGVRNSRSYYCSRRIPILLFKRHYNTVMRYVRAVSLPSRRAWCKTRIDSEVPRDPPPVLTVLRLCNAYIYVGCSGFKNWAGLEVVASLGCSSWNRKALLYISPHAGILVFLSFSGIELYDRALRSSSYISYEAVR